MLNPSGRKGEIRMLKKIGNTYADKCQRDVNWMRKHPTFTGFCILVSITAAAAEIASLFVDYYTDKEIERLGNVTFDEEDEEEF